MKNINFCLDYEYSCFHYDGGQHIKLKQDETVRRNQELMQSNYYKKSWGFVPSMSKYLLILYSCVELYQKEESMDSLKNFRDFRHKWGLVI